MNSNPAFAVVTLGLALTLMPCRAVPQELEIAQPDHTGPVEFHRDILPILQVNCLPCHNRTTPKADLLLETAADILRGGESGPAVIPGRSDASLLFRLSAHRERPRMPPKDNKVNATHLSPSELGLLALWINEGALDTGDPTEEIHWRPLAASLEPILAVAVSPDSQFAAAGRGNRIEIIHLPTARRVALLTDLALESGGAHRDLVHSLAFSPDSRTLVSGGFREIKWWERVAPEWIRAAPLTNPPAAHRKGPWIAPDGSRTLGRGAKAILELFDAEGAPLAAFSGDAALEAKAEAARRTAERAAIQLELATGHLGKTEGEVGVQQIRQRQAREAVRKTTADRQAGQSALANAIREQSRADHEYQQTLRQAGGDTNAAPVLALEERRKSAATAVTRAGETDRTASLKASTAANEESLARDAVIVAASQHAAASWRRRELAVQWRAAEAAQAAATNAFAHAPRVRTAAFSPNSRRLATLDSEGRVVIRLASSGNLLGSWQVPEPLQMGVLFFATDDLCLVGDAAAPERTWSLDLTPRWRLRDSVTGGPTTAPVDRVLALAFSPDGRWLAAGGGEPTRSGEVWLWEAASRKPVFGLPALHSDTVASLAFSPDGRWLASAGADRFARLVEVASGRQVRLLEGHAGHVLSLGWDTDGLILATAGADLVVNFWDLRAEKRIGQATGFTREVTGIAHLPATPFWIAASGARGLRVLARNGENQRELTGNEDFTQALAVTPDGRWVVAGGQDGVLHVWSPDEETPRYRITPGPTPTTAATIPE
ncbi:MAG: hypothetical protein KF791_14540 [Verrucomicrobiae bacterium]|nr:hypothetical protein [Verrucomicrobiae bacterium]